MKFLRRIVGVDRPQLNGGAVVVMFYIWLEISKVPHKKACETLHVDQNRVLLAAGGLNFILQAVR